MSENPRPTSIVQLVTLHEVRGYLRRSHGTGLAVFIGVAYALASMLIGGMLVLARLPGGYTVLLLWGNALGLQPWNYPGLLITAPWGFLELPFTATVSMALVAAGVGLGMAVALILGYRLLKGRKGTPGTPAMAGSIAGLTPALIGLVTLGACCSVTAAATAGVGLVAQASGSSTSSLLLNNWFLGVFQVAVVYVALIAQELLLRIYGTLFAGTDPGFAPATRTTAPLDRRTVALAALRAVMLAAGVTWVLAVLADWTMVSPLSASVALWFNWLAEHWLLGGFAVFAALAPRTIQDWSGSIANSLHGFALRCALLVGAVCLGGWLPPLVAGAGVEGFGNELLSVLGAPAGWGAVAPVFSWGVPLLLRWALQYLLLAGFAAAVAIWPARTLDWLAGPTPHTDSPSIAAVVAPSGPTRLPDIEG